LGGARSTYRRDEKCITIFCFERLKLRDQSEDLALNGKIILERLLGEYFGNM